MLYLAHKDGEREQTILEHLTETAEIAAVFATEFKAREEAYRCALLHDIGKYSAAFQRRIRGAFEKPDHSTAGALEAIRLGDFPAAFCIAGHHGGLPNMGSRADAAEASTLWGRKKRRVGVDIEDYGAFENELPKLPTADISRQPLPNLDCYFFTKMLYSCLVDADYINTEDFMSNAMVRRGGYDSLSVYREKLATYIEPWQNPKGALNKSRSAILSELLDANESAKGIFSLTVPTGGGKTVASMAFALKHANEHALKRIIYVIPYTSIIEQTQHTFENIFGKGSVLAHYSGADFGNNTENDLKGRLYLASENWDAPVILTTSVQFFESLFAASSSKCRKLHNIANSVIIFDEAQMLPVPFLSPCVAAISQLVKNYGCTAVLCTATQPVLNPLLDKLLSGWSVTELCPRQYSENDIFKRVTFKKEGLITDEELAKRLNAEEQVLCIVNSRKQAQRLFKLLDSNGAYHLSTMMYSEHRGADLEKIRARLKSGEPCRVISTSLIEAGVDVDFPTVYRAIAGLDSVIQAAGRCNREGKRPCGESIVHIFNTEQKPPEVMLQNIAVTHRVLERYDDISSAEAVYEYFDFLLYKLKDESTLDGKSILRSIESGAMAFRDIGERFRIIEGSEYTLYIPEGDGKKLTDALLNGNVTAALMRKLGRYSVGVYKSHFIQLLGAGAIQSVGENAGVLLDMSLYDHSTGLSFGTDEGKGIFI